MDEVGFWYEGYRGEQLLCVRWGSGSTCRTSTGLRKLLALITPLSVIPTVAQLLYAVVWLCINGISLLLLFFELTSCIGIGH